MRARVNRDNPNNVLTKHYLGTRILFFYHNFVGRYFYYLMLVIVGTRHQQNIERTVLGGATKKPNLVQAETIDQTYVDEKQQTNTTQDERIDLT